jgi:hypothetical protein
MRPLPVADTISRTDDIEIGRNEAFRANRIDQHAPRSFTDNLERRNWGDVAGIDICCHAIHMIVECTVPKAKCRPKKKIGSRNYEIKSHRTASFELKSEGL